MDTQVDDFPPLDFSSRIDTILTSNEEEIADGATLAESSDGPMIPLFQRLWDSLHKEPDIGPPKLDTVCLLEAMKAMRRLVELGKLPTLCGHGFDLECGLLGYGWASAKAAYTKYDPAKDTGNGPQAYLFKCAEGAIRNAAWKEFSDSGKRLRFSGAEVIHAADALARLLGLRNQVSAAHGTADAAVYAAKVALSVRSSDAPIDDSEEIDGVDWLDAQMVLNRATFAPHGNAVPPYDPFKAEKTPGEILTAADLGGLSDGEVLAKLDQLLRMLPEPEDRALIERSCGIGLTPKATLQELAEKSGCSKSTIQNRIKRLKAELQNVVQRV
jgi:hypothetical protein